MKFSVAEDHGKVVQVTIQGCLTQPDIAPPLDPFRQVLEITEDESVTAP